MVLYDDIQIINGSKGKVFQTKKICFVSLLMYFL